MLTIQPAGGPGQSLNNLKQKHVFSLAQEQQQVHLSLLQMQKNRNQANTMCAYILLMCLYTNIYIALTHYIMNADNYFTAN